MPSACCLATNCAWLQESEIVRKDKYFSTVGAKMKAAREKLPSLGVKHAVRSDLSIFTTPPTAEVHSLLPHVKPEQVRTWHQQSSVQKLDHMGVGTITT
jgi:hypothetical protein